VPRDGGVTYRDTFRRTRPRPSPGEIQSVVALTRTYPDPSATALIDGGWSLTDAELDRAVTRVAAALCGLGLRAPDQIAACSFSDLRLTLAFLACQRLGLIWVGVNRVLANPGP
jgi:acyl-CoA synthetase (AMP-forming)/AMP-acid ligase II